MDRQAQKRIMREDAKRRNAREQAETALLTSRTTTQAPEGIDPYLYARGITGTPSNKNRTYHVAPSSWEYHNYKDASGANRSKRMRCVGEDVIVTFADGTTETRTPNSFRAKNLHTQQREHATTPTRTATPAQHDHAQDYQQRLAQFGAIGNVE